ncbi:MAG: sugar phosphate isomerase/epimerase [Tannerella sp.]|jgi:sugar phosphate isomerase/epimerase|nr:sugar phosphate isomerase/epimerase [Tannerella sp.]
MALDRRNFIRAAAVTVGGAALSACGGSKEKDGCCKKGESACCKEKACKDVKLNLSFQEGTPPGANLNEKFDFMEKLGIVGFEPGGRGLAARVDDIKQALNGRNIKVSAICAGFSGFILSEEEKVRRECIDTMHEILTAAGELGSTGVIIVPAFNSQVPVKPHTQETRDFLCEQFDQLGTFAVQHNTTIILEPLNRKEAFYLRLVADAASICRDINNPGVRCLGDFWHMTWEETSDMGAFLSAGKYLQHVHMASRKRRSMPGEDGDADNYVDGFKGLKLIGYDKYVSFECGCQSEDRAATVTAAVQLLRDQWEQA